jgi:RND family efflux transporter MFP subunit
MMKIPFAQAEEPLMNTRLVVWLGCSLVLACGAAGSGDEPPAKAPEVPVARPLERRVTDHEDYTGRTEAAARVELRARVTGYLDKISFKEGAEVKRGDVLFEIDPRPYKAELDRAEAAVVQAETRLKLAEANYKRMLALAARAAISREEVEKARAERDLAQAEVRAARATLEVARLTLSFTRVVAPLDGRIGRRLVDPGNLVKADETVLATIVSSNPMYVYFQVDERTVLRLRRAQVAGKLKAGPAGLPVMMALADEKGFPHRGTVNFADTHIDPNTGTLRLRAVLANADGLLLPGLFVRVRLPVAEPYRALLVPERAVMLGAKKGERPFVYVVNDKNELVERQVELGARYDGLRAVKGGLKATDWVVIGGLEGLRPGTVVRPRKAPMPELAPKTPGR